MFSREEEEELFTMLKKCVEMTHGIGPKGVMSKEWPWEKYIAVNDGFVVMAFQVQTDNFNFRTEDGLNLPVAKGEWILNYGTEIPSTQGRTSEKAFPEFYQTYQEYFLKGIDKL